ncbi:hypothetical protein LTS18_005895, partial [Coniosporium uncinatum]
MAASSAAHHRQEINKMMTEHMLDDAEEAHTSRSPLELAYTKRVARHEFGRQIIDRPMRLTSTVPSDHLLNASEAQEGLIAQLNSEAEQQASAIRNAIEVEFTQRLLIRLVESGEAKDVVERVGAAARSVMASEDALTRWMQDFHHSPRERRSEAKGRARQLTKRQQIEVGSSSDPLAGSGAEDGVEETIETHSLETSKPTSDQTRSEANGKKK